MSSHNYNLTADDKGHISISKGGSFWDDKTGCYEFCYGTQDWVNVLGVNLQQTIDADTTDRTYASAFNISTTLTGGSESNSNFRPRTTMFNSGVDMVGHSYTKSGNNRGPLATSHGVSVYNSGDSAAILQTMSAQIVETVINHSKNDMTVVNGIGVRSTSHIDNQGDGAGKFNNHYSFWAENPYKEVDKGYGFYVSEQQATEGYAFYDNSNSISKFGPVVIWNDTKVNMEQMIRKLEKITGETFVETK